MLLIGNKDDLERSFQELAQILSRFGWRVWHCKSRRTIRGARRRCRIFRVVRGFDESWLIGIDVEGGARLGLLLLQLIVKLLRQLLVVVPLALCLRELEIGLHMKWYVSTSYDLKYHYTVITSLTSSWSPRSFRLAA